MTHKPKPDDRRDNVRKLQEQIDNTIANFRESQDMISLTDNEETKQQLIEKNKRRLESLEGKKEEIRDEAIAREKGYK